MQKMMGQSDKMINEVKGKLRKGKAAKKYSPISSKVNLLQTAYYRALSRDTLIEENPKTNEGFKLLRKTMTDHEIKQYDEAKATAENEVTEFNEKSFEERYQNRMDTMLSYENTWRLTFKKVDEAVMKLGDLQGS